MRGPIAVTLGGVDYQVRPFNLEQRRRLDAATARRGAAIAKDDAAAMAEANVQFAYDVVAIAMERAEPKPLRADGIEPASGEEFWAAFSAITAGNRSAAAGEAPAPAHPETAAGAGATSTAS